MIPVCALTVQTSNLRLNSYNSLQIEHIVISGPQNWGLEVQVWLLTLKTTILSFDNQQWWLPRAIGASKGLKESLHQYPFIWAKIWISNQIKHFIYYKNMGFYNSISWQNLYNNASQAVCAWEREINKTKEHICHGLFILRIKRNI